MNRYKIVKCWILAFAFLGITRLNAQVNVVSYVNPMIGTDYHGHTFPGAALPGGLVQLGPDTDTKGWDWCSGYHYSDSSIMGFSHLHRSGMGAGDWGDILVMPTTGDLKIEPGRKERSGEGYRSAFSHQDEKATPGYYSVILKDYKIKAELTVSPRAGFHQYTFPKSKTAHILIDVHHGIGSRCTGAVIEILSDTEIAGHRSSRGFVRGKDVYFYAKFSKPFQSFGTWSENTISGMKQASGIKAGAFINYTTSENEIIQVKVGISYTSVEQAKLNLTTEIPNWNFEEQKATAENAWSKSLSKIEVQVNSADDELLNRKRLTAFYTAVYHSLLFPATFSDVDGKYRGLDGQVHGSVAGFTYLSDFSLWDTFRAEMPLLTLIDPKRSNDAVQTMIAQFEQGGWLPTPQQFGNSYTNDMIGDHPVSAILDAYQKGIRNYDLEKAYQGIRKNAVEIPPVDHRSRGRIGLNYYSELGYLPYNKVRESVSRTLEYAYNDWCVAQLAKALMKPADYEFFMKRAMNYKNIIDSSNGFARPKNSDGNWLSPFDPRYIGHGENRHYTEANAWQYSWFVPHDVQGLIDLEGGNERFIQKLDSLFSISSEINETVSDATGLVGQYAHGNEPGHHTIYLYNYAGVPWKTQNMVRKVIDELYHDDPAGLCGNEDMGQMSAWYVLSTMGFYPVAPGQNVWVIGSPVFSKVVLHTSRMYGSGKDFIIEARNNSKANKYIQSATLNGKPFDKTWFDQEVIKSGGKLVFEMGPEPNKNWATGINSMPPSVSGNNTR